MGDAHSDVSKHVKAYLYVFGALAVFTLLTVAASKLHTSGVMHVAIALFIASIKASLVAIVFMHLKWERSVSIWWSLAVCAVFFAALMLLPVLVSIDLPPQVQHGTWG